MTYRQAKQLLKTLKSDVYWIMVMVSMGLITQAQAGRLIKEAE